MLGYGGNRPSGLWNEMERFSRDMNRLFSGTEREHTGCCLFPPLNIYENDEAFIVRGEMPGVEPNKLEVSATARSITIKGERTPEPLTREEQSYHRRERDHGTFNRSFTLPQPIDPDRIVASYKHGVLEVLLPKTSEARPRRIAVNG